MSAEKNPPLFFLIVIYDIHGREVSPLDQKQPHTLHSSYKFNSQNVLKSLESPVNCFYSKLKKVTVPKVCLV